MSLTSDKYGTKSVPLDPPSDAVLLEGETDENKKSAFYEALVKGVSVGDGTVPITASGQSESLWAKVMRGMNVSNYEGNPNDAGTAAIAGAPQAIGSWDFMAMFRNGTFIVLGIVVVALAVLSNKQVQKVAAVAVTKGRK